MATSQRQKKEKEKTPPVKKKASVEVPELDQKRPGDPTTMGWKLAQVLGEIHTIPKEGINEYYGYKYILEDTLTNQIRPILAKWGLALVFGAEKVEDLEGHKTSDGQNQGYWTRVWCRFTLFDSDGHEFSTLCPGEGTDANHPDKALYKAMTGATKYFLYKTFLVSTGDEPERDDSPQTTLKKQKKQKKESVKDKTQTQQIQDSTAPDMMTTDQLDELKKLSENKDNFNEQLIKVMDDILERGGSEGSAKRIIAEAKRQNEESQQKTNGEDKNLPVEGEVNEEDIPF